jgi:hypothetical protein
MMPSNRLALLAMLALGYLGLLSTHVSEFATLLALLIEQCVALGILTFFVPLNIWNIDELTRTLCPDPRGSSSSIQVRALRPRFSHTCNWRCHWNFDFDNCPLLCGDRCVHRTATTVVVQTSILLQVLLGFLVPFLLPSFITSRLIKDQD